MTPRTRRARALRWTFRRLMKDKHSKALVRRFWPAMRTTVNDIVFDLHPADNTTEFRLFTTGEPDEPESLAALVSRVRERKVRVFDIGANCGLYALTLARAAAAGSTVHAFEPSPVMAARLERNVSLNGLDACVKVHCVALGASTGHATLNVHAKNHGQSSLLTLEAGAGTVSVAQDTLLTFVGEGTPESTSTIVKIDVEGHEDDVLHPFLERCPPDRLPDAILVEVVLESRWQRDLRGALATRGYRSAFEAEGNVLFERDTTGAGVH